jgi:NDP-sugar pyrophosphorylase family protein
LGIKALILAAGYGSRLRPLTDITPKPLLSYFGPTLLDHAIFRILKSGISHIAVNTHYLASQIEEHLSNYRYDQILVSHEPEILGTGGAVNPLREWIGGDHLLIYNADVITDIDIRALVDLHLSSNTVATMTLLPQALAGKTPVYASGNLVSTIGEFAPASSAHTFACAHILSPTFLQEVPNSEKSEIMVTYKKMLTSHRPILWAGHSGIWHDLGSPEDFWGAYRAAFSNMNHYFESLKIEEIRTEIGLGPSYIDPAKQVFIANGAEISDLTLLDHVVVLPGAKVPTPQRVSYKIMGKNATIQIS